MASKRPRKSVPAVASPAAMEPAETSPVAEALAPAQGLQSGEALTTAQGLRLRDTDHSLKAGPAGGRRCWRTSTFGRRSPTSITSGYRSGWCTREERPRTGCSVRTAAPRR
nr:hypothetical protein GCM10020092_055410 [Actinoplanes digitatis]